ncbi:bifunctional biotin--[acetyl-CoA-carboxylase] ligase/biotin operon repressor BirA [Pantoea sp. A4]|uniref:bifunctional biotin--[acetyl-CoA-carboxylase] ligase/biotin operon repressor BirA n=1 Tax=Pantoea sp. A4 TaxID=1225184 RepID=UPI00038016ED|nr:bifunctional biotin--[acetyl-CoA-carboxylase] ligase/biotin operon repressor BirA [Pantoea sp. A4]
MKDTSVPLKLVSILADGQFHSGEQLGELLGMSRAAINKHMQTLKEWGLEFLTVTGKGYSLTSPVELLNEAMILPQVPEKNLDVVPVLGSTNQYLLDNMHRLASGFACVAEYQNAGRGRRGRVWVSPFGANLYLSMYWKLEEGPAAAMGLSLVIGIVVAEVLQSLGAEGIKVKWPNDLYLNDKKLAGILVELTGKTGDAAHIVLGAGINLAMSQPAAAAIDQQWINLQDAGIKVDRNQLAASLINELRVNLRKFEQEGLSSFTERWAKFDNYINRPVKLLIGDRVVNGIARGIDHQGGLLLEHEGEIKAWVGGEISLRPQTNL